MTPLLPAALSLAVAQTPLTLGDALARAAAVNPDLRAAEARLAQARAAAWKAWSAQLPAASLGASYTRNSEEARLPTGFWIRDAGAPQGPATGTPGVPGAQTSLFVLPSGEAALQTRDQLGAQLQVTQALVAPQAWFSIQAAGAAARAAERGAEQARRQILFGVAQVYTVVASLRQALDVEERLLESSRRREREAEARLRAGAAPRVVLVRAQVDRARAEQDVRRASSALAAARIGLAALLDRDADFEVVEPPEPALPADLEALAAGAEGARPDVAAARLARTSAEAQRRAASSRYLPTFLAFGRSQWSSVEGFAGKSTTWAAGVALSWALLDGGLREAELREAEARAAESAAALRAAELRARAEVRQAMLDLESARANARKAEEQRALAAENLRLVETAWRAGSATAVEQADAAASLRNAEIALTAEVLGARLAALRVLQAAGAFDPVPRA